MKEYEVHYNQATMGGYLPQRDTFLGGPNAGDTDGYLAPGCYEDDDSARYAAYLQVADAKERWPDLNKYPYREPRIYERDVSEWKPHDS